MGETVAHRGGASANTRLTVLLLKFTSPLLAVGLLSPAHSAAWDMLLHPPGPPSPRHECGGREGSVCRTLRLNLGGEQPFCVKTHARGEGRAPAGTDT